MVDPKPIEGNDTFKTQATSSSRVAIRSAPPHDIDPASSIMKQEEE